MLVNTTNLMKNSLKFTAIALLFALAGCQVKNMSEKFKEFGPVILADDQGTKYIAEHHLGNTYTLKPLNTLEKAK